MRIPRPSRADVLALVLFLAIITLTVASSGRPRELFYQVF